MQQYQQGRERKGRSEVTLSSSLKHHYTKNSCYYWDIFAVNFEKILDAALVTADMNHPANIYLFKVTIETVEKRCEICSKSTITTSELGH